MRYNFLDRFDNLSFRNNKFIHEQGQVSAHLDNFHLKCASDWTRNPRKRDIVGVSKKEWKASSDGIRIDTYYIGQYE